MFTSILNNQTRCLTDTHRLMRFLSATFSSFTSDLADVTITVGGGAKVQIVCGDITNETTDAVVNTTDFKNFQTSERSSRLYQLYPLSLLADLTALLSICGR